MNKNENVKNSGQLLAVALAVYGLSIDESRRSRLEPLMLSLLSDGTRLNDVIPIEVEPMPVARLESEEQRDA